MSMKKSLIDDPIEALMTFRPMYKALIESCDLNDV